MKAILEFDLDSPEDVLAHKRAISADDLYLFLWDLDELLCKMRKYEIFESYQLSEIETEFAEKLSDKIYSLIENRNIDMGNLE